MAWTKGQSGNPKGRKKGALNKDTREIRNLLSCLVCDNINQLKSDISTLSPLERIEVIIKLLAYVQPKPLPVDVNKYDTEKILDFTDFFQA